MMALVRDVTLASTASGQMLKVLGSMSTNTGFAPSLATADAVAKNVKLGSITSSPD